MALIHLYPGMDTWNSNLSDYMNTLESIKNINIEKCLSNHFDNLLYDINIWLDRCFKIISNREDNLIRLIQKKLMSIIELAKNQIIYDSIERLKWPMNEFVLFFEQNMLRQHLNLLVKSGEIKQDNENYFSA